MSVSSIASSIRHRESSLSSSSHTTAETSAYSNNGSSTPPASVCIGDCNTIPTEVFVAAAAYLSPKDLNHATQVCRSWRQALHSKASLWETLTLHLDKPWSTYKALCYAQRASHSLKTLACYIGEPKPEDLSANLPRRIDQIRQTIIQFDGGAEIETFEFQCLLGDAWGIWSWDLVLQHLFSIDPSLPYLRRIQYARFVLGFQFMCIHSTILHHFNFCPRVELVATSQSRHPIRPEDFLKFLSGPKNGLYHGGVSMTQQLSITGAFIDHGTDIPNFACLEQLRLCSVHVGLPFLYILARSARTLVSLQVDGVAFMHLQEARIHVQMQQFLPDEPMEEDVADDLVMPRLRQLLVRGKDTAPFWQRERKLLPQIPHVRMPNLDDAELISMQSLEEVVTAEEPWDPKRLAAFELLHQETEWTSEEDTFFDLRFDALWTLCATSSTLLTLNLTGSTVNDASLAEALRCVPNLQRLILCGTCDVTNYGIELVAPRLPALRYLDVRATTISPRAVARMAEEVREHGGRLCHVLCDDPGPFFDTEAQLWDDVAYKWLDWIGILVDWHEAGRPRRDSKRVWRPQG